MLSFLDLFFAYETEFFWKRMHPPRVIWIPHYACAHWSFQNSGRCKCTSRGMVIEGWFPPLEPADWREKNQAKKILNEKTRHWLLGKNSKRHNLRYTEWNYALQKEICLFKYKKKLEEGFWFIVTILYWISRQLNAASHVYYIKIHNFPPNDALSGGFVHWKTLKNYGM